MSAPETRYRSDIDGLRALSILLVVAYHAQPGLAPGGFVGVDVFFVISGFLITRIISAEMADGSFSLAAFYARRVRRLFPALLVVLAATYIIGWFVLFPDQFELLAKNIVAGVAFAANLFQIGQASYFEPHAAENPLLHLWSLGIEEQFYIFWPPVLWMISRSARRRSWILFLALLSFCAGLVVFAGDKDWSFYSPLTRAWELLAGCLLAGRDLSPRPGRLSENLLSGAGLAAILASAFLLDNNSSFPGFYGLLPVVGAGLILASPNALLNRGPLSSRPMVWLGLISYPLYLWHWPLLSYLSIVRNGVPNVLDVWAGVAVAVILSALTFYWIERPLRRAKHIVPRLVMGQAMLGAIGVVTVLGAGLAFRFPAEVQEVAGVRPRDNPGFADHCFLEDPGSGFDASCIEEGTKPLLFLWGDSTAAAIYPPLKALETSTGAFRLARFTSPGCAPIMASPRPACSQANDTALGFLAASHPDVVLLHAMWDKNVDLEKLRQTIAAIRADRVSRIVLLGPVPVWKRTLPHELINHYRFFHLLPDRLATGFSGVEADTMMRSFASTEGIEYISARQALCDVRGCLTRSGPAASDLVTTDIVHLSHSGAAFLVNAIRHQLLPAGTAPGLVPPMR